MTALLEHVTALLEYIDLILSDTDYKPNPLIKGVS